MLNCFELKRVTRLTSTSSSSSTMLGDTSSPPTGSWSTSSTSAAVISCFGCSTSSPPASTAGETSMPSYRNKEGQHIVTSTPTNNMNTSSSESVLEALSSSMFAALRSRRRLPVVYMTQSFRSSAIAAVSSSWLGSLSKGLNFDSLHGRVIQASFPFLREWAFNFAYPPVCTYEINRCAKRRDAVVKNQSAVQRWCLLSDLHLHDRKSHFSYCYHCGLLVRYSMLRRERNRLRYLYTSLPSNFGSFTIAEESDEVSMSLRLFHHALDNWRRSWQNNYINEYSNR